MTVRLRGVRECVQGQAPRHALTASQLTKNPLHNVMANQMIVKAADAMYGIGDHNIGPDLHDLLSDHLFNVPRIHLLHAAVGQVGDDKPGDTNRIGRRLQLTGPHLPHLLNTQVVLMALPGGPAFGECEQVYLISPLQLLADSRCRTKRFIVWVGEDVEYFHRNKNSENHAQRNISQAPRKIRPLTL